MNVQIFAAHPDPPIDEVAVFIAATDMISMANVNVAVADSLKRLARVVTRCPGQINQGTRVCVVTSCPHSGEGTAGFGMLQVTLGGETGTGNPTGVGEMLNVTFSANLVERLAGHVRRFICVPSSFPRSQLRTCRISDLILSAKE